MNERPEISTVVLSWNRSDLLRRTLETYEKTIAVPHEVIIVDNASNDDSRYVIDAFCGRHPNASALLLTENMGGAALNEALARADGRLLHISENDLEYLPGWCERVLKLFDAFPTLGQLSLFGPVPTDEEAWELKPAVLRHSRGLILYEALGNVGTSSVLRREIWDRGVRVTNVPSQGSFLFPDDSALSRHIKEMGYLVAWADHYLVRNVGHCLAEFAKHPDYYRENYTSKQWLGVEGWQRRIETQRVQPRPFRSTFLPVGSALSPEKSSPTRECPEPQLWSMLDGWTAEVETLEFLYSLARLLKPKFIVETGTWHGHAACAMGHALRANGRGRLATLEIDAASCAVATSNVEAAQLSKLVEVVNCDSLQYAPPQRIDLLLLDSDLAAREPEFWHFAPWLSPGAFVVFHDTSEVHAIVREGVSRIVRAGALRSISFATPRGLMLCQSVAHDEASDNAVDRSPRS